MELTVLSRCESMEIKKRDLKGSISKVTQRNLECQEESSDSQIFLTA